MNNMKTKGIKLKFYIQNPNSCYVPNEKYTVFICDYCKAKLSRKVQLIFHIRKYHLRRVCSICTKECTCLNNLSKLKKIVHEKKSLSTCGKKHYSLPKQTQRLPGLPSSNLRKHSRKSCRNKPSKLIRCMCGKKFQNQTSFGLHLSLKKKKGRYICDKCPKGYVGKFVFLKHIIKHNKKPFKCNVCSKSYFRISCLNVHKESHSEEIHKCKLCNSKFSRKCDLTKHVKKIH